MELAGEEKKLPALFSELKARDEEVAPRFAGMWHRAQARPRRIRGFKPAFVAAMALLVFGLMSLALWSRYSQRTHPQPIQAAASAPAKIDGAPAALATSSPVPKIVVPVKRLYSNHELVAKRLTPRRDAQLLVASQKLTQEAKTIDNWQSPTTALLSSPGSDIFSSLPEFKQSTSDLKSFLPSRSN